MSAKPLPIRRVGALRGSLAVAAACLVAACGGGGGDGGDTDLTWIQWRDNANGSVIKDASNDSFEVRASDRALVFDRSRTLVGLSVDPQGRVLEGGVVRAGLVTTTATSGASILALQCSDGRAGDIVVNGDSFSWNCSVTASGGSEGNGAGGGSGGAPGSSGSPGSAGPSGGPPPVTSAPPTNSQPPRQFIPWRGSSNGDVVLDAGNEQFKFYADTLCLYSVSLRQETTNFCLFPNSANGSFAGLPVSVQRIRADDGSCVTGLADASTGRAIDIATINGIQQASVSSRTWLPC